MTLLMWLFDRATRGWQWVVIVAVPVALAILRAVWRRQGRQEAEQEAVQDANERVEAGRQAVSRGRERGAPDERVRANDGSW